MNLPAAPVTEPAEHTFEGPLLSAHDDGAPGSVVYVVVPLNVPAVFGTRARVPIRATIDGVPYQGRLTPMRGGHHVLIVLKAIREAIGKQVGDVVRVQLWRPGPRTVIVPADLADALAAVPAVLARFEALAYSHRREYVRWIEEARRPETRVRRVAQALEILAADKKR